MRNSVARIVPVVKRKIAGFPLLRFRFHALAPAFAFSQFYVFALYNADFRSEHSHFYIAAQAASLFRNIFVALVAFLRNDASA
jgi:hypothetical protein